MKGFFKGWSLANKLENFSLFPPSPKNKEEEKKVAAPPWYKPDLVCSDEEQAARARAESAKRMKKIRDHAKPLTDEIKLKEAKRREEQQRRRSPSP